ncbi:MAG: ABC transporter permease [Proteobacteria bacterium]|nr:ABC transporter permease [Pseudomonadota bacterium]MBU1709125.1 ABC transporter permease [Pseudomonadota bacterium]
MWRRIWTIFEARNKEFYRDKSALGWNFLFPFLIIIGFNLMFSGDRQNIYKVGYVGDTTSIEYTTEFKAFQQTKYIEFITFDSRESALDKLLHHRIDLLIHPAEGKYWVSSSSPKGYVVEQLLKAQNGGQSIFLRQSVNGREIPYVEWLFPGILGMNIMFSSLFGVGFVVVRYRKNGVLKRLSVTPTRPYEFLTAQVISRMFLLMATTAIVYTGCAMLYGFQCRGSYLTLILVFALGGFSMIALGLLIASRSSSEEFAGGILNLTTWPMMFLSEVWFSLEGAEPWVQKLARIFPLTHMIDSARKVMNDGASLYDIRYQIITLIAMSSLFLLFGSLLFKWQKD